VVGPEELKEVFKKLHELALAGDLQAMRLELEYILGKPTQQIEIASEEPLYNLRQQRELLAATYLEQPEEDLNHGL